MLHLPAITTLPDQAEPVRTRETIYNLIGSVQFSEMLLEMDAATGYSKALLGHRAQSTDELVALYGEPPRNSWRLFGLSQAATAVA